MVRKRIGALETEARGIAIPLALSDSVAALRRYDGFRIVAAELAGGAPAALGRKSVARCRPPAQKRLDSRLGLPE